MDHTEYRRKVRGAWLGKTIGGTLGQPWEGSRGPLALSFYDPVPCGAVPNDDLDLQVLWACKLATEWNGGLNRQWLGQAWLDCVRFPFDEYGVAVRNLKMGIRAPWSGRYDNWFADGMGAAIRSELWACLAPADPEMAVRYAEEDGCVDHCGNGLASIRYLAALQSMAFSSADFSALIPQALGYISAECTLHAAIMATADWCRHLSAEEVFANIHRDYYCENFTDVTMNLACIVAALLLGQGDFERSICLAANFGEDADCTAATVGATLGISTPEAIPARWLEPIGEKIVISPEVTGITPPNTLDELTDLVVGLRERIHIAAMPQEPEPDWAQYRIPCRRSIFQPWFASDPGKFHPRPGLQPSQMLLPGNLCSIDLSTLPANALLLLDIPFVCPQDRQVRLLVNTPANMRVWVDDEYRFGRECGAMVPAFHRPPLNQYADLRLSGGEHSLRIGLAPTHAAMKTASLLFGFGDQNNSWLVDMFAYSR